MAKTTKVRWVQETQFVGLDENGHAVVMSGDEPPTGARPSQLLLIAMSACSAVDLVRIFSKRRTPMDSLEVIATGEQDPNPPWPYKKIHLKYTCSGKGLKPEMVDKAIKLSHEKYCSVSATVKGVAEITTDFEILPAKE